MSQSLCDSIAEVVWTVVPLELPRVKRHCPRCESVRAFAPTDKFRANANQRLIDVWLLYDCTECAATWKREVFRRCTPESIGAALYERFLRNDPDTARHYAFAKGPDLTTERGGGVRLDRSGSPTASGLRIRLRVPHPCGERLDRVLAAAFDVSRAEIQRWLDSGDLVLENRDRRALRRPVSEGTVLVVSNCSFRASVPSDAHPSTGSG